MGLGYFTNPFDLEDNHLNRAIGSNLNVGIRLGFHQTISLNDQMDISFGIGMTHFSNGNTQLPNLGVNMPNLQFGYNFYPFPVTRSARQAAQPNKELIKKLEQDLLSELNKIFENRLNSRKRELREMEREIEHIKASIEKKEKYKELIIKIRMLHLIGEGDTLHWPD